MKAKRIFIFFLVILALSIFSIIYPQLTGNIAKQVEYGKEQATLTRVVDGDTIEAQVNGEIWKIRLLGINIRVYNLAGKINTSF